MARRVLVEFWKWTAMFIVLIYLCNLRSHLIKGIPIKPPLSMEELTSDRFNYKILIFPSMKFVAEFQRENVKKRLVTHEGEKVKEQQIQFF